MAFRLLRPQLPAPNSGAPTPPLREIITTNERQGPYNDHKKPMISPGLGIIGLLGSSPRCGSIGPFTSISPSMRKSPLLSLCSGSSGCSNNPQGNTSEEGRRNKLSTRSVDSALLFCCGHIHCRGYNVYKDGKTITQEDLDGDKGEIDVVLGGQENLKWRERRKIRGYVEDLRLEYVMCEKGGLGLRANESIPGKVLGMLWNLTGSDVPQPLNTLPWRVGEQSCCQQCWAYAAGLGDKTITADGKEVFRYKQSFENARAAYRRGDHTWGMQTTTSTDDGRNRGKAGKMGNAMKGWLAAWAEPKQGNTQQKTTDASMHAQNITLKAMHAEYEVHINGLREKGLRVMQLPTYSYFVQTFHKYNKLAKAKPLLRLPHIMIDPWQTQGECACCSSLKILRQKAVGRHDQAERDWCSQLLIEHNKVARMDRLCYHLRVERAELNDDVWSLAIDGYNMARVAGMKCKVRKAAT